MRSVKVILYFSIILGLFFGVFAGVQASDVAGAVLFFWESALISLCAVTIAVFTFLLQTVSGIGVLLEDPHWLTSVFRRLRRR